ncbi:LysR substrate-binding domain-containing protein [Gluconobacter kondonii]|uniref:LysR substrate-binding domain-containing protein n=1 Tax=Gluconobacter kondonii TaxID=941463 RepID=UPI00197D7A83|nr:LysR substrate-binding domain-containing protein [Gluconobacter kondonii]MBN3868382.1 LysR family transcriptional regulator [Gluconobacter kondonii]MBS1054350.1 LysR family transcriptional regulator [Gluconobacter kondonii]MBS1058064.1 LysR family transcriptional regulator [Gluconobacter kondonii]MBS1078558.1 LysR family transcriptional regulator [Gluconobacter kondonii]
MENVDLNLLTALDVLLDEASVTGAARRLGLSPSAMSRTLTRLRSTTGDPLLVRAGRHLVPTPYAVDIRERVHVLTHDVQDVLCPRHGELDLKALDRTFTLRANEGFLNVAAAPLVTAIMKEAPRVRLRFAPKPDKDALPLREGRIDLEIGVRGASAPEIRSRLLFRDTFVGVARIGHSLFVDGDISVARYAACRHVVASRRGTFRGPVDDALEQLGYQRTVSVVVPGFPDALEIARQSDLVTNVPRSCLANLADDLARGANLRLFQLPVKTSGIAISVMWHPRMDADPAHRWFRDTVRAVCREFLAC